MTVDSDELGQGALSDAALRSVVRVLRQNLDAHDHDHLAALYFQGQNDQTLFPSTPAWIGTTRFREGRLAVVLDHVVFFQRKAWRDTYKVLFCVAGRDAEVRFWKPVALLGIGFTLSTRTGDHWKVYLDPPRGVNLTEVSAAAEQPGVTEFLASASDVAGLTSASGELLGGIGEVFALARSRRIARQHYAIWQALFGRLSAGHSAPFNRTESQPAAATTPAARPRMSAKQKATLADRAVQSSIARHDRKQARSAPGPAAESVKKDRTVKTDRTGTDAALVDAVRSRLGCSNAQARAVVEGVFELVRDEVLESGRSQVHRLGVFSLHSTPVRGASVHFRPTRQFVDAADSDG